MFVIIVVVVVVVAVVIMFKEVKEISKSLVLLQAMKNNFNFKFFIFYNKKIILSREPAGRFVWLLKSLFQSQPVVILLFSQY